MNGAKFLMGKIYLVKIKTTTAFKAPEILWAICQVGKSNVNVEGFRNIITWRLLQNAIELKAIGKVGNPVLLTKEVCTWQFPRIRRAGDPPLPPSKSCKQNYDMIYDAIYDMIHEMIYDILYDI